MLGALRFALLTFAASSKHIGNSYRCKIGKGGFVLTEGAPTVGSNTTLLFASTDWHASTVGLKSNLHESELLTLRTKIRRSLSLHDHLDRRATRDTRLALFPIDM